jgi:insulysin
MWFVGSFMEGNKTRGLAHFCEHMLFYASKKYPKEGAYQQFISSKGGMTNAYTDMEETNFYFEVDSNHLEPSLDRFAQFFVAPLFAKESVSKEMHAVDSEFRKDITQDSWRAFQLIKSLASVHHPFHHFNIGDVGTLGQKDIHAQLLHYFNSQYSANRMRLVVLGKESTFELQQMVQRMFGQVIKLSLPCSFACCAYFLVLCRSRTSGSHKGRRSNISTPLGRACWASAPSRLRRLIQWSRCSSRYGPTV